VREEVEIQPVIKGLTSACLHFEMVGVQMWAKKTYASICQGDCKCLCLLDVLGNSFPRPVAKIRAGNEYYL
jgi:hypothetical protein